MINAMLMIAISYVDSFSILWPVTQLLMPLWQQDVPSGYEATVPKWRRKQDP